MIRKVLLATSLAFFVLTVTAWFITMARGNWIVGPSPWIGSHPYQLLFHARTGRIVFHRKRGWWTDTYEERSWSTVRYAFARASWDLRGQSPVGAFTSTSDFVVWCPFWLLAVGFAVYPVAVVGRYLFVSEHRRRHRLCLVCGYDVSSARGITRCPECGRSTVA